MVSYFLVNSPSLITSKYQHCAQYIQSGEWGQPYADVIVSSLLPIGQTDSKLLSYVVEMQLMSSKGL